MLTRDRSLAGAWTRSVLGLLMVLVLVVVALGDDVLNARPALQSLRDAVVARENAIANSPSRRDRRDRRVLAAAALQLERGIAASALSEQVARVASAARRIGASADPTGEMAGALASYIGVVQGALMEDVSALDWQISITTTPTTLKILQSRRSRASRALALAQRSTGVRAVSRLRGAALHVERAHASAPEPTTAFSTLGVTTMSSAVLSVRGRPVTVTAQDAETGAAVPGCSVICAGDGSSCLVLARSPAHEPVLVHVDQRSGVVQVRLMPLSAIGRPTGLVDAIATQRSLMDSAMQVLLLSPNVTAIDAAVSIADREASGAADDPVFVFVPSRPVAGDSITVGTIASTRDTVVEDMLRVVSTAAVPSNVRYAVSALPPADPAAPACFVLDPDRSWTQPSPSVSALDIQVLDNQGQGLPAIVRVVPLEILAPATAETTDVNGHASLAAPEGNVLVRASAAGHNAQSIVVKAATADGATGSFTSGPTGSFSGGTTGSFVKAAAATRATVSLPDHTDLVVTPDPVLLDAITLTRAITIRNRSVTPLNWTLTVPSWMTATPSSGTLSVGATAQVSVTLNRTGYYLSGSLDFSGTAQASVAAFAVAPGDQAALDAERSAGIQTVCYGDQRFFPTAIAVDANYLYVAEYTNTQGFPSRIRRVPIPSLTPGVPEFVAALNAPGGFSWPNPMEEYGANLYVIDSANGVSNKTVWRVPKFANAPVSIASGFDIRSLRTDGYHVFGMVYAPQGSVSVTRFMADGSGGRITLIANMGLDSGLDGVAIDTGYVYAADRSGRIFRAPKNGGASSVYLDLTGGQGGYSYAYPYHLLVDSTSLYWTDETVILDRPGIHRVAKGVTPGTVENLGGQAANVHDFIAGADDSYVYVIHGNELRRYSKADGSYFTLMTSFAGGGYSARVSGGYVYWINDSHLPWRVVRYPLGSRFGSPFAQGVTARCTTTFSDSHHGLDLAVPVGTSVVTAAPGTVLRASFHTPSTPGAESYGNVVVLGHGLYSGYYWYTLYAHLDSFAVVTPGQTVVAGQEIGKSGSTGTSTGPHLHYEVIQSATPLAWSTTGTMGVAAGVGRVDPRGFGTTYIQGTCSR